MFSTDTPTAKQLPSNKKFGSFFTLVFLVAAVYAYWKGAPAPALALVAVAVVFAVLAVIAPAALTPLNRLWFGLGLLLGRIVSPIVLGVIFFLVISPVSLVTRLFGRDALLIKKRDVRSYWIDRVPAGPEPESFRNQF